MICSICIKDEDTTKYDRLDLCKDCYRAVKAELDKPVDKRLKLKDTV